MKSFVVKVICVYALAGISRITLGQVVLPDPDAHLLYFTPDGNGLVKGTTVDFEATIILVPTATDAVQYLAELTVNGKKLQPWDFRMLPLVPPAAGGAAENIHFPSMKVMGPRVMTVQLHLSGTGLVYGRKFEFSNTAYHYNIACDAKEFVVARLFQKLFHRCF